MHTEIVIKGRFNVTNSLTKKTRSNNDYSDMKSIGFIAKCFFLILLTPALETIFNLFRHLYYELKSSIETVHSTATVWGVEIQTESSSISFEQVHWGADVFEYFLNQDMIRNYLKLLTELNIIPLLICWLLFIVLERKVSLALATSKGLRYFASPLLFGGLAAVVLNVWYVLHTTLAGLRPDYASNPFDFFLDFFIYSPLYILLGLIYCLLVNPPHLSDTNKIPRQINAA